MPNLIKRLLRRTLTPLLWNCTSAELGLGKLSYSQFGEDLLLKDLFGTIEHGFYVDVGAFHPIYLSNTYGLYRMGWTGLAIDANPEMGAHFRRFRPRDEFLPTAVGARTGRTKMTMFAEGAFNCLEELAENVPAEFRAAPRTIEVSIKPLAEILGRRKIPRVDFLNVDCEGADLQILQSNDWSRWRPGVVCVEDQSEDWRRSGISQLLESAGYDAKYRAGLSSVFVHSDQSTPPCGLHESASS